MKCNKCGSEININDKFCGVCGAEVELVTMLVDDPGTQPQQNPYAQPLQPDYSQPEQQMYAQPVQPTYGQPAQPQYGQPAQPQYGQPAQPIYDQPIQPQYSQPVQPQYNMGAAPINDPVANSLAGRILGFGIAAIACAGTFYFAFLGIIFGAIAKSNANQYVLSYPLAGKAKAGRILGNIGFILGIVFTSILLLALIINIAD